MTGASLPRSWQESPLADLLASMESGSRPPGGVRSIASGVPSIGGEHLNPVGGFTFEAIKYVPRSFYKTMRRGHIRKGDVLVVKDGATTGKVALVREDFPFQEAVVNEHVFVCRPGAIDSEYLFWFLQSPDGQRRILEHFKGTAQGGITTDFATRTFVPVAPRETQRRIAKLVERAESRLTSARERVAGARASLQRFRQAVLAAASSGRLTAEWRTDHPSDHASSLAAKLAAARQREQGRKYRAPQLNTHSSFDDLPESWVLAPLGHLLTDLTYGTAKRSEYGVRGTPILRIPNVSGPRFDISDLKFTVLEKREAENLALQQGDLLMVRSNGSVSLVGKTSAVPPEAIGMAFAGYLLRLRVDAGVECKYVEMTLASPRLRAQIELPARSTSGVHNINSTEVRNLAIPLPPRAEQVEVVRRVERLLTLADDLQHRVDAAASFVHRTSDALLDKAFRGGFDVTGLNDESKQLESVSSRSARSTAEAAGL